MSITSKNNQGLTLVEVLVAISILLMSVVMPMVIYSNSIVNARYAGEQITATFLAQEAIELVKYRISTELNNNAATGGNDWFDVLPRCSGSGFSGNNICSISAPSGDVCRQFGGVSCDFGLYINSDNLYTHDNSGTQTIFSRTVWFENNPDENAALVSSTVTWDSNSGTKSVTVQEYITKWR